MVIADLFAAPNRRSKGLFWCGTAAVSIGVFLHFPMFVASAAMGFCMVGMRVDASMILGMILILTGTLAAGCALIPARSVADVDGTATPGCPISTVDSGPLRSRHLLVFAALSLAL